jgi:hypothetical protein
MATTPLRAAEELVALRLGLMIIAFGSFDQSSRSAINALGMARRRAKRAAKTPYSLEPPPIDPKVSDRLKTWRKLIVELTGGDPVSISAADQLISRAKAATVLRGLLVHSALFCDPVRKTVRVQNLESHSKWLSDIEKISSKKAVPGTILRLMKRAWSNRMKIEYKHSDLEDLAREFADITVAMTELTEQVIAQTEQSSLR